METIQFYNDTLYVGTTPDGTKVVAIKPICMAIGVAVFNQQEKVRNDPKYRWHDIVLPSAGGPQSMFCIPLDQVTGWLFTINANKVKPESREALLRYQKECMTVLNKHFMPNGVTPRSLAGILADRLEIAEEHLEVHDQEIYDIKRQLHEVMGFSKKVKSTLGHGLQACKKLN